MSPMCLLLCRSVSFLKRNLLFLEHANESNSSPAMNCGCSGASHPSWTPKARWMGSKRNIERGCQPVINIVALPTTTRKELKIDNISGTTKTIMISRSTGAVGRAVASTVAMTKIGLQLTELLRAECGMQFHLSIINNRLK